MPIYKQFVNVRRMSCLPRWPYW